MSTKTYCDLCQEENIATEAIVSVDFTIVEVGREAKFPLQRKRDMCMKHAKAFIGVSKGGYDSLHTLLIHSK